MSIPAERSVRAAEWPLGTRPEGELRVDGARMLRRLAEISRIGARPGHGITRLGLTPEETEARAYLAGECHRDGLVARTDQAGNLVVRRARRRDKPALLLGSHIDTVADGGRLDGTYGVMAACEVLRVLAEHDVELDVEPVVVAFTNEEGAFFPYPFFGSLGLVGQVDTDHAKRMSAHGVALPDALRAAGGDLDTIAEAAWAPGSVAGYLELHIEQGPVLEEASLPIGVVQAITGRTVLDITVCGGQDHAGTTPMRMRRDALAVASRAVLAVERLARSRDLCRVATVGKLDVEPNTTNVIPGLVRLTAELRDGRAERLRTAEQAITTELAQLASATDTTIDVRLDPVTQPVATDHALSRAIADAADELGLRHLGMDSGAGHDAQIVAAIAPIGMIFVPSRNGISHAPQEETDDLHLVAGADTLLRTVLGAGRP
ncbi:Zn-dependent hydrolase [Labedaea rhizosphaerae]|uniref:N-carbamoyl-L-amino-acid hydrolase n=1 Tax=Labedaea rhizosphaerae TaxID=598644 RepID=A0A4R6RU55_LABRH|nr:Zn-dependent hydrolase [Labedaea rhizosphaerae]TDP89877.1 N-carbamoyl-L-amino-acid hydrolase [Labedaea rhizosphaerae]